MCRNLNDLKQSARRLSNLPGGFAFAEAGRLLDDDFGEHEVVVARPDAVRTVFQNLARTRFRAALGHDVVDASVGRLVRAVVALESVCRVAELPAVVQFVVGVVPAVLDEVAHLRRIFL